jgi:hypothetical protein
VPVVVSVLLEDEPIEELLPDVDGVDDVSVLLEGVALVELEPLEEPVPEAPMLELGDVLLDELVDGEAPIVDDDDVEGEAPAALLGEVVEAPVDGEVVEEPLELTPEPAVSPPVFGAVEVLLLLAPVLPAAPPAAPPVWATA